jgi:hypothetical protein
VPLERKRPEDKSRRWRPKKSVRLYLDEVDEILGVLRNVNDEVRVETAEYVGKIRATSELEAISGRTLSSIKLTSLRVDTPDHEISFETDPVVQIYLSPSDSLELSGASQRIQEIVNQCQTRFAGSNRGHGRHVVSLVFGCSVGLMAATLGTEEATGYGVSLILPVAIGLCVAWTMDRSMLALSPGPQGTIVLAYRNEAPTWCKRNKTAVGVSLATNLISGVVFFLLGKWIG